MESTESGNVNQDVRPLSTHIVMEDEKIPLQSSLPRSSGKSAYTQSLSEQDLHGSHTPIGKKMHADISIGKYPWNTGIFTRFPFLGVLPLLLSVACKLFHLASISACDKQVSARLLCGRHIANKSKVPALPLPQLCTATVSW